MVFFYFVTETRRNFFTFTSWRSKIEKNTELRFDGIKKEPDNFLIPMPKQINKLFPISKDFNCYEEKT